MRRVAGTLVRVAIVAGLVGAAWWFGNAAWGAADDLRGWVLQSDLNLGDPQVEVVGIAGGTIELTRSPVSQLDGLLAVRGPNGTGRAGAVRVVGEETVLRDFSASTGSISAGDVVSLGPHLSPGNPLVAHGIRYQDVEIPSELGALPAWLVPGVNDVWVVFVHGWDGVGRGAVNNVLPQLVDLGYPVLAITYRGDPGAPVPEDGLHRWGLDEWPDVEAAVAWAREQGAERVVMLAHDRGASLVSTFLHESALAPRAIGAIYDSPVLAVDDIADTAIRQAELQKYLAGPAKALAAFRFHVRWASLDQVGRAEEFKTPILLIHGSGDDLVPVATSDEFAAARPDLVSYERFEGAGHLLAWNVDRPRYELAIRQFLARLQAELAES